MQRISKNELSSIAKLKQKKFRDLNKVYVLSGLNVVSAAVQSNQPNFNTILIREDKQEYLDSLRHLSPEFDKIKIFNLTEREFKTISDEEHPQGIAIIAEKPESHPVNSRIAVYLDRINDPGNLGTIIRTACWFGIRDLLLSPGSADPFQPKVVRSSAGMIAYVNIIEQVAPAQLKNLKTTQKYTFIGTFPDANKTISQIERSGDHKIMILFGSEAHGINPELESLIDQKIMIPAKGPGESLNLAVSAGIICYELGLKKQASSG